MTWADLGEEPMSNEGGALGGQADLRVGKGSSYQDRNMEREHEHDGGAIGRLPSDSWNGVYTRDEVGANVVSKLPMYDER